MHVMKPQTQAQIQFSKQFPNMHWAVTGSAKLFEDLNGSPPLVIVIHVIQVYTGSGQKSVHRILGFKTISEGIKWKWNAQAKPEALIYTLRPKDLPVDLAK